jgi:hypothetical protein
MKIPEDSRPRRGRGDGPDGYHRRRHRSAIHLYKYTTPSANDTIGVGTVISASLKAGTSALLVDTGGSTNDTCTSSEVSGTLTVEGGTATTHPSGDVNTLTFGGCTHTTDVLAKGELEVKPGPQRHRDLQGSSGHSQIDSVRHLLYR